MDGKTVTGIGLGVLLLGGATLASKVGSKRDPLNESTRRPYDQCGSELRFYFRDRMREAGKIMGRARSRNDFIRAKMELARASENLFLMRAIEGDRPDHYEYFDAWEEAVEELETKRGERGMRPLPPI